MKGLPSKRIALKADVKGPEKCTVCRRVLASFSPEILQAGAVKGLSKMFETVRTVSAAVDRYTFVLLTATLTHFKCQRTVE